MTQRRFRRNANKRSTMWLPFYQEGLGLSAGGVGISSDLLSRYQTEVGREVPIGTTIGPIIGNVSLLGDTVGATFACFAAIQLVHEGETASETALELEPGDFPWYGTFLSQNPVEETAAGVFQVKPETFHVMTRAMRKTRAVGDQLHIIFNEVSSDAGFAVDIALHCFLKFP